MAAAWIGYSSEGFLFDGFLFEGVDLCCCLANAALCLGSSCDAGGLSSGSDSRFGSVYVNSNASSKPFDSQDLISNSPYCLPNNSFDVSSEKLGIGSAINPLIDIFLHSHHLSA